MNRALLLAPFLAPCPGAVADVVNALDVDGSDSYMVLSDVGNNRTQNGSDWTAGVIVNHDSLAFQDGGLWMIDRVLDDDDNYGLAYDSNNDTLCLYRGVTEVECLANNTFANTTDFYLATMSYTESTDTIRYELFDVPAGTSIDFNDFTPTTSVFANGAPQEVSIGSIEIGGSVLREVDGQMFGAFFLYGVAKSSAQLESYASDPLGTGDSWLSTHGSSVFKFWFDDTITCPGSVCTDVTGNAVTMTLSGGATLGSMNGPDVPARAGGGGDEEEAAVIRRRRIY